MIPSLLVHRVPRKALGAAAKVALSSPGILTRQLRRSAFKMLAVPAAGAIGAGVLVGVGVGLVLAPMSGKELRQAIRSRLSSRGRGHS